MKEKTNQIITNGELTDFLITVAKRFKEADVNVCIKRNNHMHEYKGEKISNKVIDAILVSYINHVAMNLGMDLGLYSKHLNE